MHNFHGNYFMTDLVFATHNLKKLEEVKSMLPKGIKLLSLSDIGCTEEIMETEETLEGNAILKAKYISSNYGYNCFADDTGLLVEALNGAPGVYSARYAGTGIAQDNIKKLLKALQTTVDRKAHFKTVIALAYDDQIHLFDGIVKGEITSEVHGGGGFGYDPVFRPQGYQKTFAELPLAIKNKIGHRGKALKQLLEFLKNYK